MMLKESPFPGLAVFVRVLLKALAILLVLNAVLLATGVRPIRALVTLNTWDLLGRGRARLAYPSDFQNGQLPLEALLAAHEISRGPKPPDEYRVVLIGESGIAGWGVEDEDTLAAQLTALGVEVGGRRVVAYNLAYPQPGAPRDALILDAALAHDPDLIVWFMTPAALNDSPDIAGANRVFFNLNRERLERLAAAYPDLLGGWYEAHAPALLDEPGPLERYIAIQDQDLLPVWLNSLFYPFETPDLARSERRIGSEPVPEEARYTLASPGFEPMPNDTWGFLLAGCQRARAAGADLLLVNEPMLVGGGPHADKNYNVNYGRDLYDRYREALRAYAAEHGIWYSDLWNIIPAERFTDTPLHMDAEGFAMLADALRGVVTEESSGSTCER